MHASASWPSVNASACTTMISPTTRFTAKRPQSISGMTLSTTARTRPSGPGARAVLPAARRVAGFMESFLGALAFMPQIDDAERGERYANRMIPAMRGYRVGMYAALVADAAAAVDRRVGIQDLAPEPRVRHPEQVVLARHGRHVAHDEHHALAVSRLAYERERGK